MATQTNEQKTTLEAGGRQQGGSSTRFTQDGEPPYESRTRAVLMNVRKPDDGQFVTDDERKQARIEVFQAAKKILADLEVPNDWFTGLEAMRNGKGAELDFTSHGTSAAGESESCGC